MIWYEHDFKSIQRILWYASLSNFDEILEYELSWTFCDFMMKKKCMKMLPWKKLCVGLNFLCQYQLIFSFCFYIFHCILKYWFYSNCCMSPWTMELEIQDWNGLSWNFGIRSFHIPFWISLWSVKCTTWFPHSQKTWLLWSQLQANLFISGQKEKSVNFFSKNTLSFMVECREISDVQLWICYHWMK